MPLRVTHITKVYESPPDTLRPYWSTDPGKHSYALAQEPEQALELSPFVAPKRPKGQGISVGLVDPGGV